MHFPFSLRLALQQNVHTAKSKGKKKNLPVQFLVVTSYFSMIPNWSYSGWNLASMFG